MQSQQSTDSLSVCEKDSECSCASLEWRLVTAQGRGKFTKFTAVDGLFGARGGAVG